MPHGRAYDRIWRDVRAAVDLCHRDGSLKREVAASPSKYIHDVRGGAGTLDGMAHTLSPLLIQGWPAGPLTSNSPHYVTPTPPSSHPQTPGPPPGPDAAYVQEERP